MKDIRGKKILRQLLTAAVVIVGLTYFSTLARTDFNDRCYSPAKSGLFDLEDIYAIYKIGDSPHMHISIEHCKEKNGYTPVVLSTGNLTIVNHMGRDGSVFEYKDIDNQHKEPLFMIDAHEGNILIGKEAIPCEITFRGKMRTRMRLSGENAEASVAVSKDKKEGEFYLFNERIQAGRLCFIKDDALSNEPEVRIFGPYIYSRGKFVFNSETNSLYSIDRHIDIKEINEREKMRLSAFTTNSGENIPLTERQALIALYNSTNGDSWTDNDGWKTPPLEADGFADYGTEGNWYGITVESGHVTRIYLAWNNLTGIMPPDLENLTNLESLDLWDNLISGSIPPELGNLDNLVSLDLCQNLFSGCIPGELGNLGLLKSLVLNINNLSGNIPPELGNIMSLENLSLYNNYLSGSIPVELGNLVNLRDMDFWDNPISGSIPPELGNLSNLEYLGFGRNNLTGSIPPELGNLGTLEVLYLSFNSLAGSIPPELGQLTNLDGLCLEDNDFSGSIPSSLGNLNKLENLYLSFNSLSGSIPPELSNLNNLFHIRLAGNILSGEIPGSITNLTALSNYGNDFGSNALYTDDSTVINFLNEKDPDWVETQTIAPTNVSASLVNPTSIRISWTPIVYTDGPGGYEVHIGTSRPYTHYGTTEGKTVSSMQIDDLTPGTTYYFVVRTVTYPHDNYPYDKNKNTVTSQFSSIGSFTIPLLTIHSPNGGENWTLNTTHNITWEALYLSNNVHIILEQDGVKVALIARNINPAPGSYSWKVGDCLKGAVTPGTNYKVLIKEKNSGVEDRSDSPFSICEPFLTVTAPNGGENWTLNDSRDIAWLASGLSHNINIILEQSGTKVALIARDINPMRGCYSWTVGECLMGSVAAGTNYKIVLKEKDSTVKDKSNDSFSISEPWLTVSSPKGGENWEIGSTHDITWQAAGIAGNLKITLWKDGSLIGVIANNINPLSGSLSWQVGQHSGGTAAPGRGYQIKIKEKNSPVSDTGGEFSLINE